MGSMHWTDEESRYLKAIFTWQDKSDDEKAAAAEAGRNNAAAEFRVLVLGAKGVGKTSLLTRFCDGPLSRDAPEPPNPRYERGCRHPVEIDGQRYMVDALELPAEYLVVGGPSNNNNTNNNSNGGNRNSNGNGNGSAMLEQALNITEGALLVYDAHDPASQALARDVHDFIRGRVAKGGGGGAREYALLLVGNKSDLIDGDQRTSPDKTTTTTTTTTTTSTTPTPSLIEVSARTGSNTASVFPHLGRAILRARLAARLRREAAADAQNAQNANANATATTATASSQPDEAGGGGGGGGAALLMRAKSRASAAASPLRRRLGLWRTLKGPFLRHRSGAGEVVVAGGGGR